MNAVSIHPTAIIDAGARILPVREEKLKERLGSEHRDYLNFSYLSAALFRLEASPCWPASAILSSSKSSPISSCSAPMAMHGSLKSNSVLRRSSTPLCRAHR